MRGVHLYVLVTSDLAQGDPVDVTRAAVRGGAQLVQLREKTMPKRPLLDLARAIREVTLEEGALFVINDHVDIAALCSADGVHQGQDDLPPAEVRKVLGPEALVGVSTHAPDQARRAERDGADYIGVGPIFETETKRHRAAVGLEFIRAAHEAASIPGFAIGSVNRQTLDSVIAAGATRVAVCTGIIAQPDVEAAARWFRARLDRVNSSEARGDVP
ncbi:MAG: thiamine phosphate synthase [Planctomycetes bacterium]|nr:thiamine phosphate synthase [Planctomycetota bacterium]